MSNDRETYGRTVQLGASRRRREDAEKLQEHGHYQGATYLAGYAIECSMKTAICDLEDKLNYKDTNLYKIGVSGASIHELSLLKNGLPVLQRYISGDTTGTYRNAWNTIVRIWKYNDLRYSIHKGNSDECKRFMDAMIIIHDLIIHTIIPILSNRRR